MEGPKNIFVFSRFSLRENQMRCGNSGSVALQVVSEYPSATRMVLRQLFFLWRFHDFSRRCSLFFAMWLIMMHSCLILLCIYLRPYNEMSVGNLIYRRRVKLRSALKKFLVPIEIGGAIFCWYHSLDTTINYVLNVLRKKIYS